MDGRLIELGTRRRTTGEQVSVTVELSADKVSRIVRLPWVMFCYCEIDHARRQTGRGREALGPQKCY